MVTRATIALGLLLAGCSAWTDFDRFHAGGDGGRADGGRTDGGRTDGGVRDGAPPDTGSCTDPRAEECNGRDDDCDGTVDEGFDLETDPSHCGTCGAACEDRPHGAASCGGGTCGVACDPDYADCDDDPVNGCEADLGSTATCGGCAVACDPGELCSTGGCVSSCPSGLVDCGGSCVDTDVSPLHCGGCGMACPTPAGGRATCAGGTCGIACDPGLGDCNGDPADGCEASFVTVAHCGGCGRACAAANAVPSCGSGGACAFVCTSGFANCDGAWGNGCEVPLGTAMNCTRCGESCSGATPSCNATMGCVSGCASPTPVRCGTSCVDTGSNPMHCGGCDRRCFAMNATSVCSAGACVHACNSLYGNCNGTWSDGCEVDLRSTLGDCGSCGATCHLECYASACDEAAAVVAGGGHSCAIQSSGRVTCWGQNGQGQLGTGTTGGNFSRPQRTVVSGARQLDGGSGHTCAAMTGGTVRCWGANTFGQLGDGTVTSRAAPVAVLGLPPAESVSAVGTGLGFSCASMSDSRTYCWGSNLYGQLGRTGGDSRMAVQVTGSLTATTVAAGDYHACAITSGGGVVCWGYNAYGQLGDGTYLNRFAAVGVPGISGAVKLAAGGGHTCVGLSSGGIRCWGDNSARQLGSSTFTSTNSASPIAVTSWTSTPSDLTAGGRHTCATTSGGALFCWGLNGNGQVGDGTVADRNVPTYVAGGITGVHAGQFHTCAVDTGSRLWCWGASSGGCLGDGTFSIDRHVPTAVVNVPPPP